jgi:hypothetical protein
MKTIQALIRVALCIVGLLECAYDAPVIPAECQCGGFL